MTGLSALVIVIYLIVYSPLSEATEHEKWTKRCINNVFCFMHPESLKPMPAQINDSIAGSMQNENIKLSYDYGFFSQLYTEYNYNASKEVLINRYPAHIYFGDRTVILAVPNMPNKLRFSMKIDISNDLCVADAEKIINSVYFIEAK